MRSGPRNAAMWGNRVCRTRSGSPAGANGLIRGAADSAWRPPPHLHRHLASHRLAQEPPEFRRLDDIDRASATLVDAYLNAFAQLDSHEIAALALTLGVLLFAVVTAIMLVRTRLRLAEAIDDARDQTIASRAEVDRVYALLRSEPQILIAWAAADDEPEIVGDHSLVTGPETPHRVLAFGTWLEPETAQTMETAVEALRARGEKFSTTVTTLAGRPIEAEGQVVGGRAILRLKDVSGVKRELAELLGALPASGRGC